jgi:hypothetical protein
MNLLQEGKQRETDTCPEQPTVSGLQEAHYMFWQLKLDDSYAGRKAFIDDSIGRRVRETVVIHIHTVI